MDGFSVVQTALSQLSSAMRALVMVDGPELAPDRTGHTDLDGALDELSRMIRSSFEMNDQEAIERSVAVISAQDLYRSADASLGGGHQ